jgi:predicted transcriptional regulator
MTKFNDETNAVTVTFKELLKEIDLPETNPIWDYPYDIPIKFLPKRVTKSTVEDVYLTNNDTSESFYAKISAINAFTEVPDLFVGMSKDAINSILMSSNSCRMIFLYIINSGFGMEKVIDIDKICKETQKSKPTVYAGINELIKLDFIKKISQDRYAINITKFSYMKRMKYIQQYIYDRTRSRSYDITTAVTKFIKRVFLKKSANGYKAPAREMAQTDTK